MVDTPARHIEFWLTILRAAAIGALSGVFAVVFLSVEHALIVLIWGGELPTESFSGGWRAITVPIAGGLIVGMLYVLLKLPPRLAGFIEDIEQGRVEPSTATGGVAVALVSLVAGASLGPEAPLATGAGGAVTWFGERRGASAATVRSDNEAAVSGLFGGLLSSPFIGALLTIELEHDQSSGYTFRAIVPAIVAGVAGFLVINPVFGDVFLGRYEFEPFELEYRFFAIAVGVGVLGAAVAVLIGVTTALIGPWFARLDRRPVVRALIGGIVIAAAGYALPLTMFSGIDQLDTVIGDAAAIGVGLLLIIALIKIITLVVSLGSGFYGGPFFPVFFIGGTIGTAFHLLVPGFPLALSVGAFMGAIAGAAVSIPLTVMIFAVYVVGLGPPAAGVIGVASITGFILVRGFGLAGTGRRLAPD